MPVPPMPDTLANPVTTGSGFSIPAVSATRSQKPTSAIVNIVYAMRFRLISEPEPEPGLGKKAKIGIGVGVSGAAVFIGVLLFFLIRKIFAHKKLRAQLEETSVNQRFGRGVDTSRVAHEQPNMSTTYGGSTYTGVPTTAVH